MASLQSLQNHKRGMKYRAALHGTEVSIETRWIFQIKLLFAVPMYQKMTCEKYSSKQNQN
jgi:hypothetical protein